MAPRVRRALAIDRSSPARDRTVDITTLGRRSRQPHRIEIWFYRVGGVVFLSALPGKKDWYANLQSEPRFTFHLKHGVAVDLSVRATPVTDEEERRRIFGEIVDDLNQPGNPGRIAQPANLEDWVAGSPLMEVSFDEQAGAD